LYNSKNDRVLKSLKYIEEEKEKGFASKLAGYTLLYVYGNVMALTDYCKIAELQDFNYFEIGPDCLYATPYHPVVAEVIDQFITFKEGVKYQYVCSDSYQDVFFSEHNFNIAYFHKANENSNIDLQIKHEGY